PLSLSRKAGYFCAFRLRLLCNSTPRQVRWAAQSTRFAVVFGGAEVWGALSVFGCFATLRRDKSVGRRGVRGLRLVTFHVMNGACFFCTFLIPILEIGIIAEYLILNGYLKKALFPIWVMDKNTL
ncbi:MAG: hypothetical protein IKD29_03360, partial [Lentisphaeria bacterium]|nr:hypothetical protein [Lentisphaeria bacterium]